MAARDVLRIVLDQFQLGGQIRPVPDGRDLRAGGGVDQRHLRADQVGHFGRHRVRQAQELGRHGKIGHVAAGGFFERGALERLVLAVAGSQHAAGQGIERGGKGVAFQVAQHLIEDQVIDVIDRIGGDEDRPQAVTAVFIDLIELAKLARFGRQYHKTVFCERPGLGIVEFEFAYVLHLVQIQRQAVIAAVEFGRDMDRYRLEGGKSRFVDVGRRRGARARNGCRSLPRRTGGRLGRGAGHRCKQTAGQRDDRENAKKVNKGVVSGFHRSSFSLHFVRAITDPANRISESVLKIFLATDKHR